MTPRCSISSISLPAISLRELSWDSPAALRAFIKVLISSEALPIASSVLRVKLWSQCGLLAGKSGIDAGNPQAALVTRAGKKMRQRRLKFASEHIALDWCMKNLAGFVLLPRAAKTHLN